MGFYPEHDVKRLNRVNLGQGEQHALPLLALFNVLLARCDPRVCSLRSHSSVVERTIAVRLVVCSTHTGSFGRNIVDYERSGVRFSYWLRQLAQWKLRSIH